MSEHKEKIKVNVRIRPKAVHIGRRFSKSGGSQEKCANPMQIVYQGETKNELVIRKMDEKITEHHFAFDDCFWPAEELREKGIGEVETDNKKLNPHKLSERLIFEDICKEMLFHSWEGYNIAVLAYGQSGSGKSWTLWGNGNVKGLLSSLSSEIYKTIKEKEKQQSNDVFHEFKFGMLEIYNENMVDLISPPVCSTKTEFLRNEKEFTKATAVTSNDELLKKFEEGMTNRAKYYSYINLQSDKGYTCTEMTLIQRKKNGKGDEMRKSSMIHLIELPAKEKTYPSTSRNKDSKESSLEKFIEILMNENGSKRSIKSKIGESKSAKYLYNAVENSKTFLIVNVIQDSQDYDTTFSTLSFGNEVQQLHTKPRINEESTQKLIRDLKNENECLRKLFSNPEANEAALVEQIQLLKLNVQTVNKEEIKRQWTETIKMQIKENEREIKGMSLTYEDKLKQGKLDRSVDKALHKKFESDKKQKPHFTNLHSDPQINGRLVHFITPGTSIISGNIANKDKEYFIHIPGIGIEDCHAAVTYFPKENKITLKPCFSGSHLLLNGKMIQYEKPLANYDRITIGSGKIWLFQNPKEQNPNIKIHTNLTYKMAEDENFEQDEILEHYAGRLGAARFSGVRKLIHLVNDANIMSSELDRKLRFQIMILPHDNENKDNDFVRNHENLLKPEEKEQILFRDLKRGYCNIWSVEKFLRRVDDMKHFYSENCHHQAQIQKNEDDNVADDPFKEPTEAEIFIGHAQMPIKPLAYLVAYHQYFDIIDVTNETIGKIEMTIAPCDISGIDYIESSNVLLQDPYELIGKSLHSKFKILHCTNIFPKYKHVSCHYDLYILGTKVIFKEESYCYAKEQKFEHEQILTFENISKDVVDSILTGSIIVKIYGKLNTSSSISKSKKQNFTSGGHSYRSIFTELKRNDSDENSQSRVDLIISKKLESRQKETFKSMQLLIEQAENIGVDNIPVNVIKLVANSKNKLKVNEIIDTFIETKRPSLENSEEKQKAFFSRACAIQ